MKKFSLSIFLSLCLAFSFAQSSLNVELLNQFNRGDERYSGSWFYVNSDGDEYALIGAKTGTGIYLVSDEGEVEEVDFIPGPSSNWREIVVVADHAYVTTEASSVATGMQIIDLSDLPNQASLIFTYTATFTRGHIIQKDIFSDDPYIYICGTTATEGIHILDVSNPTNPLEVGLYQPGYYIHDCHVRGDIMFAAAFYEGKMDIVDISNKANPTLIGSFDTPGGKTHSSSMSMDGKYLFVAPEQDGLVGTIWNIEDFEDPTQVATYTANIESLVHNPYVVGDFAYISHNTEGLRVVDFADPELPVEVGYYDTYNGPSGGFSGLWSACPYLPSGKIIGGNREDGLYIWQFNNTRAARAYGLVRDSVTQEAIVNAEVYVEEFDTTINSDLLGNFKFGSLDGTFTFIVSAENYISKTISVDIAEGGQENLVFDLAAINATSLNWEFQQAVNIYPNPASELLTIDLGTQNFAGQLNLINELGQNILSQEIRGDNIVSVPVKHLARGKYWIEFKQNNQLLAKKSIILN